MVIEAPLGKLLRNGWLILIFGFIGFLIWGIFFPLDQGIPANGVVIVEGNRKIIQHQQGGTIEEILFKDGDEVESGQVLVRLNKNNLESTYRSIEEQIKGLERAIPSIKDALQDKKNELNLIGVRIENFETLVGQGFLSKSYLNEYQQKYAAVKGDLALRTSNLAGSQSELADLKERLKAISFELNRLEIKSPVKGTVMNSQFFTIGGVLPPGGKVMEIVPFESLFEVEILIPVNLIDKVSQNNEVELNFPSLNRSVTPRLKGRLVTISADRIEDSKQPNIFYFKAKAIFEDQQMCKKMNIKVGMLTQVFIKTGNRSFLSYLIKPLVDRFNNSLN